MKSRFTEGRISARSVFSALFPHTILSYQNAAGVRYTPGRREMIFVSAGFDAHRDDEMAMLCLLEPDYAWVTQQVRTVAARHAGGRIVSMLEGGYDLGALARSVAAHSSS